MQQLEKEELFSEEQSKISQLDEDEDQSAQESLLNEQYLLETSTEEEKDPARNGTLRMVLVLVGIGGFLMVAIALWNLFSVKPKEIKLPQIVDSQQEDKKTNTEETDRLKAELALRGQKSQRQQTKEELQLRKPVYEETAQKPAPLPSTKSDTPPRTVPTKTANKPTTAPKPEPKVNPVQSWTSLSNLGLTTTDVAEPSFPVEVAEVNKNNSNNTTQNTSPNYEVAKNNPPPQKTTSPLLKEVVIGRESSSSSLTTGKYGILNRTNTVESSDTLTTQTEIPIGTIVKGEIVVPMIRALSIAKVQSPTQDAIDTDGLFVIALTKDLAIDDNSVILPAGTMFVVNAKNISNTNGFVDAEVVAVIYRDSKGALLQQQIEPGAIIALGEELEPLIAEGSFDPGGQIASNDFLLGALSSLGKVGEIMNQPKSESQVNSAFGSSVSTTSDPNLLGAVMQGFFQPIAQSLSSRSEDVIKELQNRETVAVLPVGKQVSLIIKGFVKVAL